MSFKTSGYNMDQWSDCDCREPRQMFTCGCGAEHASVPEARIIHWAGQHWYLVCAFRQSLVTSDSYYGFAEIGA